MGVCFAISACINCGRVFPYNPVLVPSVRVNGSREPICDRCIGPINAKRVELGLEPAVVHPNAYGACDEEEVLY